MYGKSLKNYEINLKNLITAVKICYKLLICFVQVPLITSLKEEETLISSNSSKPAIKLLINRHNNKYSYTSTSDDNLLKNIELFDKLSLWYSNRVMFLKDVISTGEICCWIFYGHGKKVSK